MRLPICWQRQRSQYRFFIDIAPSARSIYYVDISLQIINSVESICEMLFFIQWLNSITPYRVLFLEASIICSENFFLFEEALGGKIRWYILLLKWNLHTQVVIGQCLVTERKYKSFIQYNSSIRIFFLCYVHFRPSNGWWIEVCCTQVHR